MPFRHDDFLKYYQFECFQDQPVFQAVFTRRGGVSPRPWSALNLGGTVGDQPDRVAENRRRAFHSLGLDLNSYYDAWQVHSATVIATDRPRPASQPHLHADALITDTPGVALFMRFADCVPILLVDPQRKAVGLVHAGWKGVINRVAAHAVEAMQAKYHTDPRDIRAAIGPSIGPHHYEVGSEVIDQVQAAFGQDAPGLLLPSPNNGARQHLDLWSANRLVLEQAGVRRIEIAGICTACDLGDWYSYRAEKGQTGRFGAILGLKDS